MATNKPENRCGHPDFYALLDEIAQLHSDKNSDYATEQEPLSNLRACKALDVEPWRGCLVRMCDKWDRVCKLARGHQPKVDEKMEDTLKDLAVYSLLCIILWREK